MLCRYFWGTRLCIITPVFLPALLLFTTHNRAVPPDLYQHPHGPIQVVSPIRMERG
jgi:hypothetical protein